MDNSIASLEAHVTRLGVVLAPNGDATEVEGVLNPAATRTRDGKLLLYPRVVARGNTSRIGLVEVGGPPEAASYTRLGFVLEPKEPYEFRSVPGGFGCEDPRVTFLPLLDTYVMAYTAFGPSGPRIAFALSADGYEWNRLGLADFSAPGLPHGDDKDAAFFPEPVLSPKGVASFAFYHRPMHHISAVDGLAAVPLIIQMPPRSRECTRIAYVPVERVLDDRRNLLKVAESVLVLEPGEDWGRVKNGGGTPPVRIDEGWMSFFHGVDGIFDANGACEGLRYGAGIVVHDLERPHEIRYRSPEPLLVPETVEERRGIVNDVVFPTGVDVRPDTRTYDVYYGMADVRVGKARVQLEESALEARSTQESAA